ncbi:MAG TPA: branched-chain amino acid ABC transporter substrate-binding protein [Chloroflexota bacterium]|nr:branched-chain amino acid ABC transporter substrate-binding protein [Chloroflexota bacterium]
MTTTIKIGLLLPLSGANAAQGLSAEQGAQLAVNQANAANLVPGVNFALSARDDAGNSNVPGSAVNVQALANDPEVAGIVGPFDTNSARNELPLANKLDVALVSPSAGDPCLTDNSAASGCTGSPFALASVRPTTNLTFFRSIPTDPKQGIALADYLYHVRAYKVAYVVDDTGAYGIEVADAFSREWQLNGGVVVGRSSVPEGTASFVNLLTHIAAVRPDVIFFGGSDPASGSPDSIAIRRQMLQVPSLANTAFAGGDGINTPQFAQAVGLRGGPVWSTLTPADPAGVPSASTFVAQYQATFGTPGRYSASGYDSATVLLTAIATAFKNGAPAPSGPGAATDAAALRQMVVANLASASRVGVTNPISFSATGDLIQGSISIEQLGAVNGVATWKSAVQSAG